MNVLGLAIGHDSSACLFENGKIVKYAQEERFNRLKQRVGNVFEAMKYCMGSLTLKDFDAVAISSGLVNDIYQHYVFALKQGMAKGYVSLSIPQGLNREDVNVVDHHKCHAASACYTSGFDDALAITIDGVGDKTTHAVGVFENGKIRPIYFIDNGRICAAGRDGVLTERKVSKRGLYSFGFYYGMVTEALGWNMGRDEGKTMGLAPYGDPDAIPRRKMVKPMYRDIPCSAYNNYGVPYYHFAGSDMYKKLADEYGRENLAAAGQKLFEDRIVRFIGKWLKRTGKKRLCTAGGVFLNVKLNQRIREEFDVEYWPFPLASDCGLSMGAAMYVYYETNSYKPERMKHIYYGPEYSNDDIVHILNRNKIKGGIYSVKKIAKALAENKIVAWFQGRMEGGPRALGNRSILMSPLRAENKDVLNLDVKFRESFRPFCPSVIEERCGEYFDFSTPFMITAANIKSNAIPAVTHVDGTARPQAVSKETNPKFHDLLKEFGRITGHPVLLNTSFNVMGEPIIRTPEEAIRCFYGVGLDFLVMGDYVLEKGGNGEIQLRHTDTQKTAVAA